jgi:thiamine-phosphate pyrophosphorylase
MKPLRGLYAITDHALVRDVGRLRAGVAAALAGGARVVQYRDKHSPPSERRAQARMLDVLCRAAGATLVLNDGPLQWVIEDGLGGLHLGQGDGSLAEARARLPPGSLLGATCGDSLERAAEAAAAGADYLAFGAFFPSVTKPEARPARVETLRAARQRFALPLCVIGGLTPDNAAPLVAAGADLVAAVSGVFAAADITAAARRYAGLFESPAHPPLEPPAESV